MSSGSYSVNKDGYGPGGYRQYSAPYNDSQSSQEGMTTQPSVGRFTEKEKNNSMFTRKPAAPQNYDGQALAPKSNHGTHSQDSSAQSSSGGIVNLRATPRAEGKMNKGKK